MSSSVTWDAPGPGQWARDRSHMPAGCTPIVQHIVGQSMPRGMRRMFRDLGAPLDTLDARFVNGQFYSRLRPLISPDKPSAKLPPLVVLKVASRVHPGMRRRTRTAARTLASEPWNQVIHDWHHGGKAAIETKNLELQDVPLGELDDAALLAHVRACIDHCLENWEHHFWLHGFDLGPIGRYLYEAGRWGPTANELLSLLEGASPTTSAPARALVELRRAVEASGPPPATLDELRGRSPEIAAALDEFLRRRGVVLFSRYDLDGIALGERPDLVLAVIMNAEHTDTTAAVEARTAEVRARVPAQHLARFDTLLSQARAAMDLRDDNGPTTAEWPLGLLRRSMLELGRRLQARGMVGRPELAFELRPDELVPALFDGVPGDAELRRRAAERQAQKTLDAPLLLGPDEAAPPLDVLPKPLADLVGMVQTVMQHLGMDGVATTTGLHGAGIGTTAVRGRARVASSPEQALEVLEPGDVLVVAGTTPAYNLVLSLAGGVVTAEGGPMCHAAVIARELGIPAVVGARTALVDIPDGALVEVDPVAGEVRVLDESPEERTAATV
ncbi:MAG: PEP-utilizing enzyme [Ilumatobacteraceae bacterium]